MKKIVLCTNPRRDIGFAMTLSARSLLIGAGIYPLHSLLFDDGETEMPKGLRYLPLSEALVGADMLICLGGDGTILHAAQAAAKAEVPTLGINVGHKGFLADLEAEDFALLLEAVKGNYVEDIRMMLDIAVERGGRPVFSGFALNDAVASKGGAAKTIDVRVLGDGKLMSSFSGDGLIAATPTGSTAYSMSAGGPIVDPSAENMIITPICAHDLKAKSFVLPGDANVTVEIGELRERMAFLSLDGDNACRLMSGDVIQISRSVLRTRLVRVRNRSFYEIINSKLSASSDIREA